MSLDGRNDWVSGIENICYNMLDCKLLSGWYMDPFVLARILTIGQSMFPFACRLYVHLSIHGRECIFTLLYKEKDYGSTCTSRNTGYYFDLINTFLILMFCCVSYFLFYFILFIYLIFFCRRKTNLWLYISVQMKLTFLTVKCFLFIYFPFSAYLINCCFWPL